MENKFGTSSKSESQENETQKFGAEKTNNVQQKSFIDRFTGILSLQSTGFWVKKYIYSVILFYIYYAGIYESINHTFVNDLFLFLAILNLLLYPFFASVLEDMKTGRFDNVKGISSFGLTKFFNSALGMGVAGQTGMNIFFYQLLTFISFIIKWAFSFILGIISIIYMNNVAKKMGY